MPNGETERLGQLAATPGQPTAAPTDTSAMSQMPSRSVPPGREQQGQQGQSSGQEMSKLMVELSDIAQEMTQTDPRVTTLVQDTVQRLYLGIAKIYGVEDEAKLRMKKSQGQMHGAQMNQMGNL